MKKKQAGLLIAGLLMVLGFNQCKVTKEKDPAPQLHSYIKQQAEAISEGDQPGFSVVVTKKDSVVYQAGFGFADLSAKTPVTDTTVFDAASINKQLTGMAIALLEDKGEINMNDKIITYLPDLPEVMNDITINQLVHHTSGIRDWPALFAMKGWQPGEALALEDIYEMLKKQQRLNFTPGSGFLYSNSNYSLLAKIVEVVTDTTFESWTHNNIFIPLGMDNTFYPGSSNSEEQLMAQSYLFDGKDYIPFTNTLNAPGSSSLMTNTADMSKWMRNFYSKKLGGDAVFEKITQKGSLSNGKDIAYGYGLYLKELGGRHAFAHDGAWGGFRSATAFFPEEHVSVVVLSNNGAISPFRIINGVADVLFADKAENETKTKEKQQKEREINDEFFALCAGKYQQVDDKDCYLTFFKEGDEYFLNMYDKKVKLFAKSDSVYFIKEAKAEFVFHLRNGEVNSHTLIGQRGNYLALRVEDGKKKENINYNRLTGSFYSKELNVEYDVKYEDEELKLHNSSFPNDIILEHSEDMIFRSNSGLIQSVSFLEENGSITSLVINNPRAQNVVFDKAD